MSVEVAVLDVDGQIVGVNEAWNEFCTTNDGDPSGCGPGTSYLEACELGGDPVSEEIAAALRAVLSGEQLTAVTFTIPCDGIDDERWYDLCVVPRLDDDTEVIGATVMLWRVARPPAGLTRSRRLAVTVPEPDAAWDLIEAFPDGTVLIDHDGTITHANRQLEELSGYDRSSLLGQPVEMLVPDAFRSRHRAWTQGYREAPRLRSMGAGVALQLRRADRTELPVEISLAPVVIGAEAMTMASVRDVSAQRAASAIRRRYAEQSALVVRITTMVLSDAATEAVYDAVVAGARVLLGGDDALAPESSVVAMVPPTSSAVRDRTAHALAEATKHAHRGLTEDETDLLADLARQVALVMELGIARGDRQRLSMLEDRQRIARDLHDTVIQALIGIGLQLGPLVLERTDAGREAQVDEVIEQLDAAIAHLRLVVFDTREGRDDEPLADRLRQTLAGASRTLGHQPVLVVDGDLARLSPEVVNHLVPVVREALSNVARHAAASCTTVTLTSRDDLVELLVEDDGVGPAGAKPGGGTTSFRERSAMLGGTASVLPGRRSGTVLRWTARVDPQAR